ncbi:hypothetical protein HU230_0012540 [Bradyrhizobium quebecense]|uniref:Uncharacterized protein n=1 Tax=Bradyrhizobium quebecense TaxID=2748629 RepID=A0A974AAV4_9BRAD|nr:hypothetical protein [Bradyrhizobium quebecense]UGA46817.1 hypothetical protein HU230_0012540 [Bradyrhizobium quebecense]
MARSTNIYVVVPKGCMTPIAAFTVKPDLRRYLGGCANVRVWHITDGFTVRKVTEITHEFDF